MKRLLASILQARRSRGFRAFSERCLDVERAQTALLSRLVARNGRTVLARRLGASEVRTLDDLRRLPITDYDAIAPELEAALAGRPDQLVAGRPGFFGMTSGTTGYAKYVPIDEPFRAEFQSTVQHFLYGIVRDHPRALARKALYMVAPAVLQTTPGGEPAGAITGYNFRRLPALLRRFYAVPADAFEVRAPERQLYTVARFTLAAELSIAFAVTPAPLALLGAAIERHFDALLRDIHDGTLAREGIPEALHRSLSRALKPDPRRARLLAARAAGRRPIPRHLFPELALISCWRHAGAESHLAALRDTWGEVPIRHAIYSATEGWMNVPLSDHHPSGVLAVDAIVMELVDARGEARFAHELREPGRYEILLTSGAGLWRYRLGDEVEVTGFYDDPTQAPPARGRPAPMLHFVQKTGNVLSIAHDMTSEAHIRHAVEAALPHARRWVFGPDESGDRYRVVMEGEPQPDAAELSRLAGALDAALARANMGYADFRGDGLIAPIVLVTCSPATFDAWEAARRTSTVSQAKPTVFVKSSADLPA